MVPYSALLFLFTRRDYFTGGTHLAGTTAISAAASLPWRHGRMRPCCATDEKLQNEFKPRAKNPT